MFIEKDNRSELYNRDEGLYHIISKSFSFSLTDAVSFTREDIDNKNKIKDYLVKKGMIKSEVDNIFIRLYTLYITLKSINAKLTTEQFNNLCREFAIDWTIEEQNYIPSSVLIVSLFSDNKNEPYTINNIVVDLSFNYTEWHFHYRDDFDMMQLYLKSLPENDFPVYNEDSPHCSDLGVYEYTGYKNDSTVYEITLNNFQTVNLDAVQESYPEYKYYNELKEFQNKLNIKKEEI